MRGACEVVFTRPTSDDGGFTLRRPMDRWAKKKGALGVRNHGKKRNKGKRNYFREMRVSKKKRKQTDEQPTKSQVEPIRPTQESDLLEAPEKDTKAKARNFECAGAIRGK